MKGQSTNIGDLSSAIGRFGAVVQRLESLRNDPEDLSGYFTHKTVTALLLWLCRGSGAAVTAQVTLPVLGLCSQLDVNPRVADLPPNPIDYAWLALFWLSRQATDAAFEGQSAEIAEAIRWQEHALQRMNASRFAYVRLFARIDATARATQHGPFEAVIDDAAKLAQEHLRIQARPDVPLHEADDPADVEISLTAEMAEAIIFPTLLAALMGARARRVTLGEITAAWRRRAEAYGPAILAVAERLLEFTSVSGRSLEQILTNGKELYEPRVTAAVLLCGIEDTGPSDALHSHLFAFQALAHTGLLRELALSSLAELVRRDWRRLTGEPALLRYPGLYVTDIRSACNAPSTPKGNWPAIARILLAALPAVNLSIPTQIRDRLQAAANGPAPVPGRIDWLGGYSTTAP